MKDQQAMLRRIVVGDAALEYRITPGASSAPVVLLHPWFGCWQFWDRTVACLPDYTCFAADLYSLGAREWRAVATPAGLAAATVALLDAEGLERCALVGNSMGGIAAQIVAAGEPERIEKLVLVGTGASTAGLKPDYRAEIDAWLADDADGARAEALVTRLLARRPPPEELAVYAGAVRDANREFMAAVLTSALGMDLRPRLPAITARTLIVRGALDAGRTREHVRDLLHGIRDSEAIEIPQGGHSVMVDSAEDFVGILRAFLAHGRVEGASRDAGP
jgi:pimeloyl-ACP methyl ester carboxylesterase